MKSLLVIISLITTVNTISINVTISGIFHSCSDTCFIDNNGTSVNWGTPTIEDSLSGLEFNGNSIVLTTDNSPKIIGNLTHHNWPIKGTVPNFVGLNITITSDLESISIPFTLQINETNNKELTEDPCPYANNSEWFGLFNNDSLCCPYYTLDEPCSDRIKFITPFNLEYTFQVNETQYTLYLDGFISDNEFKEVFITQETEATTGQIVARLIAVCAENATCDAEDQCTIGECLYGFCQYNYTSLNGHSCELNSNFHEQCHNSYCHKNCEVDIESFDNNSCTPQLIKRWDDQCYDFRCQNGFCKMNTETFDNNVCKKEVKDLDLQCYKSYCLDGECLLDTKTFNNVTCNINTDCEGICSNGTCIGNCISRSESSNSDDDDDENLWPLLSLLALLCCIPLLCCLLLLPLLCLLPLLFLTAKGILGSAGVSSGSAALGQALTNPTYENLATEADNPLYDL